MLNQPMIDQKNLLKPLIKSGKKKKMCLSSCLNLQFLNFELSDSYKNMASFSTVTIYCHHAGNQSLYTSSCETASSNMQVHHTRIIQTQVSSKCEEIHILSQLHILSAGLLGSLIFWKGIITLFQCIQLVQ